MTHYMTRVTKGEYKIVFETDQKEHYKAVQDACRNTIYENQSSSAQLKPCPFCGGKAELDGFDYDFYGGICYWAKCTNCRAEINHPTPSKKEAIEEWNRRAET